MNRFFPHFFLTGRLSQWSAIIAVLVVAQSTRTGAAIGHPIDSTISSIDAQLQDRGTANVLVMFDTAARAVDLQLTQNTIAVVSAARTALLNRLSPSHVQVYAGLDWQIPALAVTVDRAGLTELRATPHVQSISLDGQFRPADAASDAQIGAPAMWNAVTPNGYTGAGQTIVVIDSGVQDDHPFFTTDGTAATNRVLTANEACYSGGGSAGVSVCPNHALSAIGAGTARPCVLTGCDHGTHVAGIAVGNGIYSGGIGYSGVALGANLLPIQVFSDNRAGGMIGYYSDVISALNHVAMLATNTSPLHIAAVNLSLSSAGFDYSPSGTCDQFDPPLTTAVRNLRTLGIPTVIAAGDDGFTDGIGYPACLSTAISVGAVDSTDALYNPGQAGGSDSGPNLTLLAPGVNIASAVPGSSYAIKTGTSAAAPQVAGAIALLRQENPALSINQIVALLTKTGRLLINPVTSVLQPRLQIDAAGLVALSRPRTIGIYRSNAFYLRNTNTFGAANQVIPFGNGVDAVPIVGDWIGYTTDQLGVYNQSSGVFMLCAVYASDNSPCNNAPLNNRIIFVMGNPADQPLAARWNPRGSYVTDSGGHPTLAAYAPDGVGVFRSSNGLLYLKNALNTGYADYTMVLGSPGDTGVAGDWNLDGQGSPGVYRPTNSAFYLSNQVTNGLVYSDLYFGYGSPGDLPVIGNWLGPTNGTLGVGIYRTATGYFMLHTALNTGFADNAFFYGTPSDLPVVGHWQLDPAFFRPPSAQRPPPQRPAPPILIAPVVPTSPGSAGSVPGGNGIGG